MADGKRKKRIEELYNALKGKNKYVAQFCGDQPPENPFQRTGDSYGNTFLHVAIRFKQKDLVKELLGMLPQEVNPPLSRIKNNEGNTILHELACSDSMTDVARQVLKRYRNKDPELLIARNDLGETPIFCAVRYGQIRMFFLLAPNIERAEESADVNKPHLQRDDGTTILHISINNECFELAHCIAEDYENLIAEKDQDSMTALQYLACNPIAFERKKMKITQAFQEGLFGSAYKKGSSQREQSSHSFLDDLWAMVREVVGLQESGYSVQGLVKLLVQKDASWHASIDSQAVGPSKTMGVEIELPPKTSGQEFQEKQGKIFQEKKGQKLGENKGQNSTKLDKSDESPLFLAIIANNQEILEEILMCHPHMLKHTNKEGMNILQVAILHRHIDIFEMVAKLEMLPRSLLSTTDKEGNSLLHMVGQKTKSQATERMQNPAFQLRKELLLFQTVKSACKMHLTKPLNNNHQTAEELFATSNEDLHNQAKKWLMRTAQNCTILSVFIATVAFAATNNVPGGPDQKSGIPILNSKPFFMVFILADVVSLALALGSTAIFLSILTSSFPLQHFGTYVFKKLKQGIICMVLSVSMMVVAFGASIVLLMGHNRGKVIWHAVAVLPVPIFFLSYTPLRSAVLKLVAQNHCAESFKNFVAKFLKVAVIVVLVFLFALCCLLYGAFKGLHWTVKKACEFIKCRPVRWICGNKSPPQSDTQSPHQV